ncbi:MAG: hypothetical protein QOJ71_1970 [Actinomycetota bacterium]|nr:hypothetical protein [Actinomycetota bacterium]
MLRIGTSGWQYRHWRGHFYPPKVPTTRWLEYYAERFDTVEVNNTFYRLPAAKTFRDWSARVPDGFEFAIKASNYLTHYKRLLDPEEPVDRLLEHAEPLRPQLGVVLLQLPPNLERESERLDRTLKAFRGRVRVAVEPRHPSWFCDEVRSVLEAHSAALCLADRGSRMITPLWQTADFTYVRLHHGRSRPASCYGARALKTWVARLADAFGPSIDGYVYFNNDAHGCAVDNATTLARAATRAGLEVGRLPGAIRERVGA